MFGPNGDLPPPITGYFPLIILLLLNILPFANSQTSPNVLYSDLTILKQHFTAFFHVYLLSFIK